MQQKLINIVHQLNKVKFKKSIWSSWWLPSGTVVIMMILLLLLLFIEELRLPWLLRQLRIHLQCRRPGLDLRVGKIPWRRAWQPTLVFLPGEFHGQRSLAGYSPVGHDWATNTYNTLRNYYVLRSMKKMLLIKIKCHVQGHIVSKWQDEHLNLWVFHQTATVLNNED